jgi:hypothetical protein
MIYVTYKEHKEDKIWMASTFTKDKDFVDWYIVNQSLIEIMAIERYGVDDG